MITSSSRALFLRIPRIAQFRTSFYQINSSQQFQGYHCYHGLSNFSKQSSSKGIYFPMSWNKKRKTVNPVWRPLSTQTTSNEDCSVENIMDEPGNIASVVQAVADSTISSSSQQAENEAGKAERVQVNLSSTCENRKDAEGVLGDGMAASASQNSFGVADAENLSMSYKKKHAVSVEVGASVMRFIKGKGASMQKGIEEEMGVKLIFPPSKKDDSIVIEGDSMDVIIKASEKIQAIIDEGVQTSALNYSHFISLPLAIHAELVDKLTKFQSTILGESDSKDADGNMDVDSSKETSEDEDISDKPEKTPNIAVKLKDDSKNVQTDITAIPLVSYAPKGSKPVTVSDSRIEKSLFLKPQRFHLTIVMLKLWNKKRLHAAKEVLQNISSELSEVLDNRPLFVRLKGLDCLRGTRAKAQVLYAPVEEIGNEGRLPRACQIIIDAYVRAGLVLEKDARQKLKLHATLMNTTFRRNKRKSNKKDSFDATAIFEQFGSEPWGDYHIREAHLSQRFVYDESGYYHCCTSIPFPEISEVPESSASQVEELSVAESI